MRIESILGQRIRRTVDTLTWSNILGAIESESSRVFGVSASLNSELAAPKVHEVIAGPLGTSDTRVLAYVTAVLVHEGSLIIEHGPRGEDLDARVFLRRSDFVNVDYATRHPEA